MGDGSWFRRGRRRTGGGVQSSGNRKRGQHAIGQRLQRCMRIEPLEARLVLDTYLVTTLLDQVDGDTQFGSLRWALDQTNAEDNADEIVFADSAFVAGFTNTILLNGGQLDIEQPVRILGPGPRKLTVAQGQNNRRIFETNIGPDDEFFAVEISGMTLSGGNLNGDENNGGAIYNREVLTMVETHVTGNFTPGRGGGIFNEFGVLNIDRSLFTGNTGGVGGAITNGTDDEDNFARTQITNSTFSGNTAVGIPGDDGYNAYGGAIFNRNGRLTVTSSTIIRNSGSEGAGIASYGNPLPDEEGGDPPPPTIFTLIGSSIVWGNGVVDPMGMPPTPHGTNNVDRVGVDDDEEMPMDLLPSVGDLGPDGFVPGSLGFNFIGEGNTIAGPDDAFSMDPTNHINEDPEFILDPDDEPLLADFAGSTDVYMLSDTSPAIDAANPTLMDGFDQRGRFFVRYFDFAGAPGDAADVGAVERQDGFFIVDELFDEQELEGQTAGVYELTDPLTGLFTILGYDAPGDFTIREAISFARKNIDPAVVQFSQALRFREFENNPNGTPSPATITLTLGTLGISTPTVIEGPSNFIIELDVSYADTTPTVNDGIGTRVMLIDDGSAADLIAVSISNLTIMGGDINNNQGGAGILMFEDVTLTAMTFKDNYTRHSGGGVSIRAGSLNLSGSTFDGNTAAINGGALWTDTLGATASVITVTNSTFSGNRADGRGGAIANNNADLAIEFSTITQNTAATTFGSGVWTVNGAKASTEIRGSIVSANAITDVSFATGAGAKVISGGYNFVGAGNALPNFNQTGDVTGNTNPMLGPLMITGGQTRAHAPLPGSPVIDMGDPAAAGAPMFDQRGPNFVRVFDGNGDGTDRIDIGAYELQGNTFVVDTPFDGFDGNYSTNNLSLREAIHLSNQNPLFDTITFDPMVVQFFPVFQLGGGLTADQTADMRIRTAMDIVGPGSTSLTLDGAGLTHGLFPAQGPQRIFTVDNGVAGSVIDVKISGLELRNTVSNGQGGAILSRENLTLDDMQFTGNGTQIFDPLLTGIVTGGFHGGAIFQDGASLTINNSTLSGNSTFSPDSDGGAIFAQNAAVTFYYINIAGNATLYGNSRGGGVALKNSTLSASQVTISGNNTTAGLSDGGGVFLDGSTALFEESAIAGNFTRGSNARGGGVATRGASQVSFEKGTVLSFNRTQANGAVGGALFVGGGTADVNNSTFIENFTNGQNAGGGAAAVGTGGTLRLNGATVIANRTVGSGSHGGALANLSGNLTVRNSTVSGNQAQHSAGRGGGVFSDTNLAGTQTTTVLNSTISGNSAGSRGGGLFNGDGRTEIKHSTITNNSTPFIGAGNGVGGQGNATTLTVVESSIIAGNVGSAGGTGSDVDYVDAPFTNTFQSLGSNVVGTSASGAINSFNQPRDKTGITNPLLGPLASNGGPTQTHALLAGSPAINNGSPSFNANAFTPPLTTDQRGTGFPRVLGGRIDAGAFESALSAFSADFDLDGDVDGRDFLIWQRGNGINSGATKAQGDANGDGRVNGADLTLVRLQFGGVSSVVAQAPAAVGGGAETAQAVRTPETSPLVAAVMEPLALESTVLAESASTGDAGFVAGAGVPAAAARPSYRPKVARRAAKYDAVDAAYAHVVAPASMAATDGGSFGLAGAGDDAESADDLSSEDAVFALLGEGLL